jgi:mRNA interferase MazF
MRRGEIRWASLSAPDGAGPGFRRPILVVQSNEFNDSRVQTVICVVITSNIRLAQAPGNVLLSKKSCGLKKESVANVSQLITLDRRFLSNAVARLPAQKLRDVDDGIRLVLAI